jgi:hypothetical protein
MWLQLGIASGAVVLLVAVLSRTLRRRPKRIDLGSVSDAWLAEQRTRREE